MEFRNLELAYAELQKNVQTATKSNTTVNTSWTNLLEDTTFNATSSALDYAMFRGNTPVDLTTFIDDHIDAFTYGTSAQIEKLVLIELEELKKYPEEYKAWLESNKGSTKWGEGVRKYINDVLGSAGTIRDVYSSEMKKIETSGRLYRIIGEPATQSNKKQRFQAELVKALSDKNIKSDSLPQSAYYGINILDQDGKGIQLLVGKMSAFPLVKDNFGFVFKKSPNDPIEYEVDLLHPTSIQNFTRSPSSTTPTETAIEHHLATASQNVLGKYEQILRIKKMAEEKGDKDIVAYLDTLIPPLKRLVDAAKNTDKIFFAPSVRSTKKTLEAAQYKTFSDAYDAAIKNIAPSLTDTEILILEELTPGVLTPYSIKNGKVDLSFKISAKIFSISGKEQNSGIKASRNKIVLGLLEDILKNPTDAAVLQKLGQIGSSSMLTSSILIELAKLFPEKGRPNKNILALIEPQKGVAKVVKKYRIESPKPRQKLNSNKAKKLAEEKLKNAKAFVKEAKAGVKSSLNKNKSRATRGVGSLRLSSGRGPAKFNSVELVSFLNIYIADAVKQQMIRPALVNRTGRFAESVKITSANELMIKYSYDKNPYGVFSTRTGVGPWNSIRTRDPATIIKKAILSIGANKYKEYFKNNPNVSEN